MVLFLHNRYRTTGGEERVVEELLQLVNDRMGEPAQLLSRDSQGLSSARAAASLLGGGLAPGEVAKAVRLSGARLVHAHNLLPSFGWRALAAAKAEGARVVVHLHQYRLVCAVGVCYTKGAQCTRCHGRNTLPGVLHNCRQSVPQALLYGAALSLWQRRLLWLADALIVPSVFALGRLMELGLELPPDATHVIAPPVRQLAQRSRASAGSYALLVSRLAPEKGVDVAIDACQEAGMPLVVAGDGPDRVALESRASRARCTPVRFTGHVSAPELAKLRQEAAVAVCPSRSGETFGIALAEAMATGLPAVASDVGAFRELLQPDSLVQPGDPQALASALQRMWGDDSAGNDNIRRVAQVCSPQAVATSLAAVYGPPPASP